MLKSNFEFVGGMFVGCCIAVQNFRKFAHAIFHLLEKTHALGFSKFKFQNFFVPKQST